MFECGLWVEGQICPTSRLARGLGFRLTAFELGGVDIDANDSRGASSLGPLGYLQAVDQGRRGGGEGVRGTPSCALFQIQIP